MSILTEDLPKTLLGAPIRTDYRVMVTVEQLLRDPEISAQRKIIQALDLLYIKPPPGGIEAAWDGLLWYYRGGQGAETPEQEPEKERPGPRRRQATPRRVYDYEIDAERIYAAFRQVYGIDLQGAPLHWWAFRAMLLALPDSCLMGQIMGIRAADVSKLKGPEKKRVQRLQRLFAIRGPETEALASVAERDRQTRERVLKRYEEAIKWRDKNNPGSK